MLLVGRIISLVIDFAAHVIAVRYLTKADFGAYTYALAVATLLSTTVVIGLPETISRYAPMFMERGQRGKLAGAFSLAVGIVGGAGLLAVLVVELYSGQIGEAMGSATAGKLLAILILIVPTDGLNLVFQGLFAALGRVRAIFFRQYVLVPGFRFLVALALILGEQDVTFLAVGYVVGSLLGLTWFVTLLLPAARKQVAERFTDFEVPAREIISFAVPVFVTNVFWLVLFAFSTIALGVMTNAKEVADFQAVLPPARLNYLAMAIFSILFLPTIASLYVRERFDELRDTYMVTTTWLVVLTVPVLALTTVFASTFVDAFFGENYNSSTLILVVLAIAYYLHAAAGPNSATLKVYRRLRYTVIIDLIALVGGIVLNLILIPIDGAMGAALATLIAIVMRNIPYAWALQRIAGINLLQASYLRLQAAVALILGVLYGIEALVSPGLVPAVALSAMAGAVALYLARDVLEIESTFPELTQGRIGRVLGMFLRSGRDRDDS